MSTISHHHTAHRAGAGAGLRAQPQTRASEASSSVQPERWAPLGSPEATAKVIGGDLVTILAGLDGVSDGEAARALRLLRNGSLSTLQTAGIIDSDKPCIEGGGKISLTGFGREMIVWSGTETAAAELLPAEQVRQFLRGVAAQITD